MPTPGRSDLDQLSQICSTLGAAHESNWTGISRSGCGCGCGCSCGCLWVAVCASIGSHPLLVPATGHPRYQQQRVVHAGPARAGVPGAPVVLASRAQGPRPLDSVTPTVSGCGPRTSGWWRWRGGWAAWQCPQPQQRAATAVPDGHLGGPTRRSHQNETKEGILWCFLQHARTHTHTAGRALWSLHQREMHCRQANPCGHQQLSQRRSSGQLGRVAQRPEHVKRAMFQHKL